ncbi:MAG: ABC transporter permease, partial [Myxococcota bacterium]|nr:ABC transporter permease [Myxococcota bacterium]
MRFCMLVALSHLRARRTEVGVSAITLISTLGVLVGVTALIMVLAVMEGFEVDLRDKILGSNAHLVVLQYGGTFDAYEDVVATVQKTPGVEAAAPFVYTEMMVRSAWASAGVILKGIDPERTDQVTDVATNLIMGPDGPTQTTEQRQAVFSSLPARATEEDSDPEDDGALPGMLIGNELATQLKVYVGDRVHVINPVGGGLGPMGMPLPRARPFRIAGVFNSGMYEYDTKWSYVTLSSAQDFLNLPGQVTGIEARVTDFDAVDPIAREVEEALRTDDGEFPFYVRHWKNLNRNLFSALKLEKIVMGLILSLIVMVASLNIAGTLIIMVLTRSREISILRALGASTRAIRGIFMLEGLLIGTVGTAIGLGLGLLGCRALARYEFPLDTDVYYLDTLPVVVEPQTV